jgi:hypothetical protein
MDEDESRGKVTAGPQRVTPVAQRPRARRRDEPFSDEPLGAEQIGIPAATPFMHCINMNGFTDALRPSP